MKSQLGKNILSSLVRVFLYPTYIFRGGDRWQTRGTTPLHAAAGHFSADFASIVIGLLHAGACVGALDAAGSTPLQVCTRYILQYIHTLNDAPEPVPSMCLFNAPGYKGFGREGTHLELYHMSIRGICKKINIASNERLSLFFNTVS